MKILSIWSARNPVKARILIALLHTYLVFSGVLLGIFLYFEEIAIHPAAIVIAGVTICFSFFLYPQKGKLQGYFPYTYARQKTLDFVMAMAYPLMIALAVSYFAANSLPVQENQTIYPAEQIIHTVAARGEADIQEVTKPMPKQAFRELKKSLRTQLKNWKKERAENDGSKSGGGAGLIVLVVLGMAGAGLLIAVLACSLACSGAEALAYVVLIGGWLAILALGILAIVKISRKMQEERMSKLREGN